MMGTLLAIKDLLSAQNNKNVHLKVFFAANRMATFPAKVTWLQLRQVTSLRCQVSADIDARLQKSASICMCS